MPPATHIVAPTPYSTVHRSILSAALSVGAAGIFVKLVATAKEIGVASVYGRSDAMDAFLAAALIPSLLVNLISESMNQALVPTLVRVREQEGRDRAQQLLSSSMLWMCLFLGVASALMALLAHGFFPLIASNFPSAKLDAFHPPLLRPLAYRSSHRHRHQLHRDSQHARSLRASCSRAGGHLHLHPHRRFAARPIVSASGPWFMPHWPARCCTSSLWRG